MNKAIIAIATGLDPYRLVDRALELINAKEEVQPTDSVLIKPNYVFALPPSAGVTTDSRIVEALIKFAKQRGAIDVMVGEGGAGDTEHAFNVVGIREVANKHGVKLVDLNRDKAIEIEIPEALALKSVRISNTALKSTCLINVPKLKVHHLALVTVGMKNLMGTILPKSIMHEQLDEKIVDLVSVLKPKLTVVDGLIGLEKNEVYGKPVQMNVVIAGKDVVAVDAVSAAVMGIPPLRVKHIRLAYLRGLGIGDLNKIEILGTSIEDVRRNFELPLSFKI